MVGKERCQSASAAGYRETARSRQYRLAGALPAARHGPVLPRAKSPNGGWRRAVSRLKRRQVLRSRSLPTVPPHRGAPGSGTRPGFAKGKIAKRWLAKSGVKAQALPDTGKPFAPDNTTSPGNSQQRDTARFCQGQNRQTVAGEGLCQGSNAIRYRGAARLRQHRLTGALPAAGHGPVLPRAKSPNSVWRRAVSKLKR